MLFQARCTHHFLTLGEVSLPLLSRYPGSLCTQPGGTVALEMGTEQHSRMTGSLTTPFQALVTQEAQV